MNLWCIRGPGLQFRTHLLSILLWCTEHAMYVPGSPGLARHGIPFSLLPKPIVPALSYSSSCPGPFPNQTIPTIVSLLCPCLLPFLELLFPIWPSEECITDPHDEALSKQGRRGGGSVGQTPLCCCKKARSSIDGMQSSKFLGVSGIVTLACLEVGQHPQ